MKIGILVGGRFIAFDIARVLEERGLLGGITTAYRRAPLESIPWRRLHWNPLLEVRQQLERRVGRSAAADQDYRASSSFGRWASRNLPSCDVLQAWTGFALESIRPAQARGMTVVATRGSAHIRTQDELLREEFDAFGIASDPVSPRMIERECEEYEQADYIQVLSGFALESFLSRGFPRDRILVTPVGVDLKEVAPVAGRARDDGEPLRVLYLGQVSLQKGVHYLIQAARRLGPSAVTVSLVGGMAAEGELLLDRFGGREWWRGRVPRGELGRVFAEHDVMVLPSIQDGFGAVICEAMAAGLPVVATTNTGGPDVIEEGRTGFIVPPRSVDALVESLGGLVADRDRCREMGRAASESMRSARTWSQFVDDLVSQYTSARQRMGEVRCAS